jgi:hypothetical protein
MAFTWLGVARADVFPFAVDTAQRAIVFDRIMVRSSKTV